MITDVSDYFAQGCGRCARFGTPDCSTRLWLPGLEALRRLCLSAGLSEHAKWGHPCYMHAGRNIAVIGAFRGDFRLSFFNAALLDDPGGLLARSGPNTQHANMATFTDPDQVAARAGALTALLRQAMAQAEAGTLPAKTARPLDLPEELTEALAADPDLSEAFDALTPGRQRSYVIALNGAKKPETRIARIAKYRGKILSGKGAQER